MGNRHPRKKAVKAKLGKFDLGKNKTMPIPELQRENGFVRKKKKKQNPSFEKTAVIPELSREAIVGEDNCKELGNTTALGSYTPPKNALLKIWLKKWWMVIASIILVIGMILWKSL